MANFFLSPVEYPDSDGTSMADNSRQWDTVARRAKLRAAGIDPGE